MTWQRRAALAAMAAAALSTATASEAGATAAWTAQTSGTSAALNDVACPSTTACWAVGASGTILATTDGGAQWAAQPSPTTSALNGVACASTSACVAVGDGGTILATADGGATWTSQPSGTTSALRAVACPAASACWAVGDNGTILAGGGGLWRPQLAGVISTLDGVACPSTTQCWADGAGGVVLAMTVDDRGGSSWAPRGPANITSALQAVACPSTLICATVGAAAGAKGTIYSTGDAGATWQLNHTPTTATLYDLACGSPGPNFQECWAVGAAGTVFTVLQGGGWTAQGPVGSGDLHGLACPSMAGCWAVGAAGTILAGGPDSGPPVNATAPTTSGSATDGSTLTGQPGTWTGAGPIAYAYQWRQCDSAGATCTDLAGATGVTYTVGASDIGHTLRFAVTATNAAGDTTAASAPTSVVQAARPRNTTAPTIAGVFTEGRTLTASDGSWSGTAPIAFAYQWKDCDVSGAGCTPIAGATAPTYTLASSDVGDTIRVTVTAGNVAGSTAAASAQTDPVMAPLPAGATIAAAESPLYSDGFTGNIQNVAAHSGPRLVTDPATSTQYVAYYHANPAAASGASIALSRRTLPGGAWSAPAETGFALTSRQANDCYGGQTNCTDVHEVPAMAVDSEHRVVLIWRNGIGGISQHVQFARGPSGGALTPMATYDATTVGLPTELIYPWLFRVGDALYLTYKTPTDPDRGAIWLKKYDPATNRWTSPLTDLTSGAEEPVVDGVCPPPSSPAVSCTQHGEYYAVDVAPRDGTIRIVYTWDTATTAANNYTPGSEGTTDLSYVQSSDGGRTWRTAAGAPVLTPITPGSVSARATDLLPDQHVTCIDPVTSDSAGVTHIAFMQPAGGQYTPGQLTTWNYFHGWIDGSGFHDAQVTSIPTPVAPPCIAGTESLADVVTSGQTAIGLFRPYADAPWYVWRSAPPYAQYGIYRLGTAARGMQAPIVDHSGWALTGDLMMLDDYLAPGTATPDPSAVISTTPASDILAAP